MRTTFLPSLPTSGTSVPATPAWLHEIKYDGYRLIVQREGKSVRLFSRNGTDWSDRYPWIIEAALKNKHDHFVIDGEAVVLGVDGIADFNALHSRKHNREVQHYAFDILVLDGEDLRGLPLSLRKTNLARSLARRPDGIFVAPFEQGDNRARPVPRGLQHGAGGDGVEAYRSPLPRRAITRLGQGEEPQASRLRSCHRCVPMTVETAEGRDHGSSFERAVIHACRCAAVSSRLDLRDLGLDLDGAPVGVGACQ
jgi:hypothetical protein